LAAIGRGVPNIERAWGWHLWRPRWLPGRLLGPLKRWALRQYASPIECRLDTGQRFMARPDDLVQCEIAVTGSWEGLIYRAVRPLVEPGAVVVDVGAHVGYSTLLFADWVGPGGHVYCFEPVIAHAEQLGENVRLNGYEGRVVINRVAVAAREGSADFYHDTTLNSGMGSLAPRPGQRRRFHVPLWVAGPPHAERVVLFANEANQIGCVLKAARNGLESCLTEGRIAAQRKNVLDPRGQQVVDDLCQLLAGVADARQVRHRLDARGLLDLRDQFERAVPRAPSGSVGDRDKPRLQRGKLSQRLHEIGGTLIRLGREELEGKTWI